MKVQEGGKKLSLGEVPGRAEDDDDVVGRAHLVLHLAHHALSSLPNIMRRIRGQAHFRTPPLGRTLPQQTERTRPEEIR